MNPIKRALETNTAAIDISKLFVGDLVLLQDVEGELPIYNNKIYKAEKIKDDGTMQMEPLFNGLTEYIGDSTKVNIKKIERKRVRGDKEVIPGDIIITAEGWQTEVIAVIDSGVVVYQRKESDNEKGRGIDTLFYTKEMFRTSFIKGEWKFKGELFEEFNPERIIPYMNPNSYIQGMESTILHRASQLKIGDVVIPSEDKGGRYTVKAEIGNRFILIPKEYCDDYDRNDLLKIRTLFVPKQDCSTWFYKSENSDGGEFPNCYSTTEIKLILKLK